MLRHAFLLAVILSLATAGTSTAQYLYMDSNGNGRHDAGDRLQKKGPTIVDVYLRTDQNRDGSPASCNTSSTPLQMFSYGLGLEASGGTVEWGDFEDALAGFQFLYSGTRSSTLYHVFYGLGLGNPWLDPGLYFLGRFSATITSGSPSLVFAPTFTIDNGGTELTGFGTPCEASEFNNTYTLGLDFFDADGLAAPGARTVASSISLSPNPMNPSANLRFQTSRAGQVRLQLFDVSGRLVRTVWDGTMSAGDHSIFIDGRSEQGTELRSGVYFYRLTNPEELVSGRFTIAR